LLPEINSDIGQIVDGLITPIRIDFAKAYMHNEFQEAANNMQSVENEKKIGCTAILRGCTFLIFQ
jgi:hypothetical protein